MSREHLPPTWIPIGPSLVEDHSKNGGCLNPMVGIETDSALSQAAPPPDPPVDVVTKSPEPPVPVEKLAPVERPGTFGLGEFEKTLRRI